MDQFDRINRQLDRLIWMSAVNLALTAAIFAMIWERPRWYERDRRAGCRPAGAPRRGCGLAGRPASPGFLGPKGEQRMV